MESNLNNFHYLETDIDWSGFKEAEVYRKQNRIPKRGRPHVPDPVNAHVIFLQTGEENERRCKVVVEKK